jgi:hypothetical protein
MTKHALALGLAAILTAGSVTAETTTPETTAPLAVEIEPAAKANVLTIAGVRVGNPFDSSTWWDGHETAGEDEMVRINFADPRFWVGFIDPDRHSAMHATFTNPATMAQFFELETYSAMMDFGTWMSWMDVDNYRPLIQAQTYAYWMQPGAFAHLLDTGNYAQMVSLDAYEAVLNTALDTFGVKIN